MKRIRIVGICWAVAIFTVAGLIFSRGPLAKAAAGSIYPGDKVNVVYPDGNTLIGGENTFSTHRFALEDGTPAYCGYYRGGSADGVEATSRGAIIQCEAVYQEYTNYAGFDAYWLKVIDYIVSHGYYDAAQSSISYKYDGDAVPSLTGKTVTLTEPREMWLVTQYAVWWCEMLGRDGCPTEWSRANYYYSGCFNTFGNPGECFPAHWAQIYACHWQLLKDAMTYVDKGGAPTGEIILLEPVDRKPTDGLHTLMQNFIVYGGDQTPPPTEGDLKITKTCADPTMTEGNSCYSLAGTSYGVYSDSALKKKVGTLTVADETGATNTLTLTQGTYYVKELTAGPGYSLDSSVHTVEIRPEDTTLLSLTDPPVNDPTALKLIKETTEKDSGSPDLSKAQFQIDFYGAYYDTVKEARQHDPLKTFVIETKDLGDGLFAASLNKSYLVKELSDEPYWNDSHSRILLPLGTIVITEIKAPEGFYNDPIFTDSLGNTASGSYLAQIRQNESTGTLTTANKKILTEETFTVSDSPMGSLRVIKTGPVFTRYEEEETPYGLLHTPVFETRALEGVTFGIYAEEDILRQGKTIYEKGQKVGEITTTGAAEGDVFGDLPLGSYRVVEESYGEDYLAPEENTQGKVVQLTQGETPLAETTVTFFNDYRKTQILLQKQAEVLTIVTDETTNLPTIATGIGPGKGFVFGLYDSQNLYLLALATSTEAGQVIFDQKLPQGEYFIKELEAPAGYALSEEVITLDTTTAQPHETIVIDKSGEPIQNYYEEIPPMGQILVEKTGPIFQTVETEEKEEGTWHLPGFAEGHLEGAVFEIRAAEDIVVMDQVVFKQGALVETLTTTAEGTASSGLLFTGRYTVQEVSCPEGYVLDPTVHEVVITKKEAETIEPSVVALQNQYLQTRVKLLKLCKTKEESVPGEGVLFGLYAKEAQTAADGTILQANDLIMTAAADKEGKVLFDVTLPLGSYYVKEMKTLEGYVLLQGEIPVEVTEEAAEDGMVLVDYESTPVVNEPEPPVNPPEESSSEPPEEPPEESSSTPPEEPPEESSSEPPVVPPEEPPKEPPVPKTGDNAKPRTYALIAAGSFVGLATLSAIIFFKRRKGLKNDY